MKLRIERNNLIAQQKSDQDIIKILKVYYEVSIVSKRVKINVIKNNLEKIKVEYNK